MGNAANAAGHAAACRTPDEPARRIIPAQSDTMVGSPAQPGRNAGVFREPHDARTRTDCRWSLPGRGFDVACDQHDRGPDRRADVRAPTFAKDVAPIIFGKCRLSTARASCADVAPHLRTGPPLGRIKHGVIAREMPPWGADPKESLPMRNDISLSDAQIQTIAAWVDAGAARGHGRHAAAPTFATGWTYGKERTPFSRCRSSSIFRPRVKLGVQMFYSKVPWSEDRFAEVVELRPGNAKVVHHAGIFFVDIPEGASLVNGRIVGPDGNAISDRGRPAFPAEGGLQDRASCSGAGPRPRSAPADVGKRIPAGKYVNWQIHYNPTGKPEGPLAPWHLVQQGGGDARSPDPPGWRSPGHHEGRLVAYRAEGKEVLAKADPSSTRRSRTTPNIPPYVENWSLTGITRGDRGHHALRDVAAHAPARQEPEVGDHLPDGREQTILNVPKFDFNWQFNYELAEPLKIPAGSRSRHRLLRQLAEEQVEPGASTWSIGPSRAGTRCASRSPSTRWTARI